jgi:hypothetical protein
MYGRVTDVYVWPPSHRASGVATAGTLERCIVARPLDISHLSEEQR